MERFVFKFLIFCSLWMTFIFCSSGIDSEENPEFITFSREYSSYTTTCVPYGIDLLGKLEDCVVISNYFVGVGKDQNCLL